MSSANNDWSGDWVKTQQHFWESWANMVRQTSAGAGSPAGMFTANNVFSPNSVFTPDWTQGLEQWWRAVSPQASNPVEEMFQRLVEVGKNFTKLAEQGYGAGQPLDQGQVVKSWLDNMQSGFDSWIKQISAGNSAAIPDWMGVHKTSMELLDSFANQAGLGNIPDIPGLDKGKLEWDRLLNTPALGQWREHQQQLQSIAQRLIEYQEADQVYKLAFAHMGVRSIEALRQRLAEITGKGEGVASVREFYDLWVAVNEEVYGEFAMTDEYQVIHGDYVNSIMALRKESNMFNEKLYKAANLPTRSEVNVIHQRLQQQRRENNQLKADIKRLSKQLTSLTEGINSPPKTSPGKADPVKSTKSANQDQDLSRIKGIGPEMVDRLHAQGVETLEQIAAMQMEQLKKLDQQISGNGKAVREQWAEQAKQLLTTTN